MKFLSCFFLALGLMLPGAAAQAKELRLIYSSITASQSVAWVAQETGIYRKHGLDVQSAVVTREDVIRQEPDFLASFTRAVAEGIHFLKTRPKETLKIFQKYFRTDDMEALQDAYDEYIRQIQRIPYVEPKAIRTVLEIIGEFQPSTLNAKPEQFVDHSFLNKLERGGFVEKLYGK